MSGRRKKNEKETPKEIPKKVKIIIWSVFGAILLGVLGVMLWMEFKPDPKEPQLPLRYENIEHVTTSIFEVLLGKKFKDELNEDDLEIFEELEKDLKYDVYVFIYNQDYENSEESEKLEDTINDVYNKEDRAFTIVVLNYLLNEDITSLLEEYNLNLPNTPVLVHIEGETIAEKGVSGTYLSILSKLNNILKEGV